MADEYTRLLRELEGAATSLRKNEPVRAYEHGVDAVYVNDDGETRQFRPRITNNHREHHALQPDPGDLFEWVEL
jgi:hypothetical protein